MQTNGLTVYPKTFQRAQTNLEIFHEVVISPKENQVAQMQDIEKAVLH